MAIPPAIGCRFLTPEPSPLISDFSEMRLIGAYPDHTMFAFLFQYIEQAFEGENITNVTRFVKLLENVRDTNESVSNLIDAIAEAGDTIDILTSESFLTGLANAVAGLQRQHRLSLNTDYTTIQSLTRLCELLECRCEVRYLMPGSAQFEERRRIPLGSIGPWVCIGASIQVFLLYSHLGRDSFFIPKCGCLSLKYHIYADMASTARQSAVNLDHFVTRGLACRHCKNPLTSEDISNVLTGPRRLPAHTASGKCNTPSNWGAACSLCSFELCGTCAIIRTLTARGPFCPGCHLNFVEHIRSMYELHGYGWAKRFMEVALKKTDIRNDPQQAKLEEILRQLAGSRRRQASSVDFSVADSIKSVTSIVKGSLFGFKIPSIFGSSSEKKTTKKKAIPQKMVNPCITCGEAVRHSLCPRCCQCLSCGYNILYSKTSIRFVCPMCTENCQDHFDYKKECTQCHETMSLKSMAYVCARCKLYLCNSCFIKSRGKVSQCSDVQHEHRIAKERVQEAIKTADNRGKLSKHSFFG